MVAHRAAVLTLPGITTDEIEEKSKLQKSLRRFDLVFFLICTLVGRDTIGAVAKNGDSPRGVPGPGPAAPDRSGITPA